MILNRIQEQNQVLLSLSIRGGRYTEEGEEERRGGRESKREEGEERKGGRGKERGRRGGGESEREEGEKEKVGERVRRKGWKGRDGGEN